MVDVSVFYPNEVGKTIDINYYYSKYTPMVSQLPVFTVRMRRLSKALLKVRMVLKPPILQ